MEKRLFEKEKPLNGRCANCSLSQQRGSPQERVPKKCAHGLHFPPFWHFWPNAESVSYCVAGGTRRTSPTPGTKFFDELLPLIPQHMIAIIGIF